MGQRGAGAHLLHTGAQGTRSTRATRVVEAQAVVDARRHYVGARSFRCRSCCHQPPNVDFHQWQEWPTTPFIILRRQQIGSNTCSNTCSWLALSFPVSNRGRAYRPQRACEATSAPPSPSLRPNKTAAAICAGCSLSS